MTLRQLFAKVLHGWAQRIDPPEATDETVTAPLTLGGTALLPPWQPNGWPTITSSRCSACGSWFTGTHVCHTVFPTTTYSSVGA